MDLRGRRAAIEGLDDLHLVDSSGRRYSVMESVQTGDILRVRVAPHVRASELELRAATRPPAFLLKSLRDCLSRLTDPGLAAALARGQPSRPPPLQLEDPSADGLHGVKRQAYDACLSPGLYLVWGPPGSGKTTILSHALRELLRRGKSVLLVSTTNVAVDNALLSVVENNGWEPGQLIRVGTPHLREIADDPRLSVAHLASAHHRELEQEREQVEARLVELAAERDQSNQPEVVDPELRVAEEDVELRERAARDLEARVELARDRLGFVGPRWTWARIMPWGKRPRRRRELRALERSLDDARALRDRARDAVTSLREALGPEEAGAAQLERRHEDLLGKLERARREVEGEIVARASIVATTLASFRLNRHVYRRRYDVVLIDEVGAATTPEVLLAVAKAEETAVLLGDFMQLPAVINSAEALRGARRPEIDKWLLTDVFALCGIKTPDDALGGARHIVALTTQHRFGPRIMELANRSGYGGTLRAGPDIEAHASSGDPEIVLVDTDGLDDLSRVRRARQASGWWPAGSVLATALARHHAQRGERVGVIAPYRLQVQATVEALRDLEGGAATTTEVGTVHRFQGREFDTVVFDLVEDDDERGGWVRHGRWRGGSWEQDGARLFNVGVTRGRQRLYLIASQTAVRAAGHDSVLAAVRQMVDEGGIRVVSATDLLARPTRPVDDEETALDRELSDALAEYVRVVGIHDEHEFFRALESYIAGARESIWIWAPWVAARMRYVLPQLEDAVRRGVHVTVFLRPDTDRLMRRTQHQEWARRLEDVVPNVIRIEQMHQKIVVIDESVAMVGSCNVLSHRDSREVMVVHEGARFARSLLEHEHAAVFAAPPNCTRCGPGTVELRRSRSAHRGFPWRWRCTTAGCDWQSRVRWPRSGSSPQR